MRGVIDVYGLLSDIPTKRLRLYLTNLLCTPPRGGWGGLCTPFAKGVGGFPLFGQIPVQFLALNDGSATLADWDIGLESPIGS